MSTSTENTLSSIDLTATSVSTVLGGFAAVAFVLEGAMWFVKGAHGFFGLGLKKHGLHK